MCKKGKNKPNSGSVPPSEKNVEAEKVKLFFFKRKAKKTRITILSVAGNVKAVLWFFFSQEFDLLRGN